MPSLRCEDGTTQTDSPAVPFRCGATSAAVAPPAPDRRGGPGLPGAPTWAPGVRIDPPPDGGRRLGFQSATRGHLARRWRGTRSEEHTSELQSLRHLVCRLLLEKKKHKTTT